MHYCADGSPIVPSHRREALTDLVQDVVNRIPSDSYEESGVPAPFIHETSPSTIVAECLPFCTGEPRTDAVYVLECLKNSSYRQTALNYLGRVGKPWEGHVDEANRLIYVGMTVNLLNRLNQHLNSPGNAGAHFTTVFRPVRLLDVSWWPSFQEAMRAEKEVANQLRDRFPNDYVYQL
ncbi:GIY-YIG nuclease family protein [Halogeometricum salsisoli]|uniref:GIY-YIG nuclease family protein n=1 Tax=Halogeometricum TaxID=60846 RepID=UPI003CCD7E8D